MLTIYAPCSVCGNPSTDLSFYQWKGDGWLQIGYCEKHMPKTIRVFCWKRQLRVGRFIASVFGSNPYTGGCFRCTTPWDFIRAHTTPYCGCKQDGPHRNGRDYCSGCFPLCESCWSELSINQRVPFYEKLVALWGREEPNALHNGIPYSVLEERIMDSVRAGL